MRQHRKSRARSHARRHGAKEVGAAESDEEDDDTKTTSQLLPRRVLVLIRGIVVVLERVEAVLQ